MKAIDVRQVSKKIRSSMVLENISFSASYGSVIGLKGVNGSGKTMAMRLVAGLIHPTEGEIYIDGKLLGREIEFPPSIGVLIENPAFIDIYSGPVNLKLLAEVKGIVGTERIDQILDLVGLKQAENKKYKKYSLGMKQRLGIAAAVLESPKILLLDEPTNALDADGIKMLMDLINDEKQRGAAIIIACHDAQFLEEISDEIYSFSEGKITEHRIKDSSKDGGWAK